MPGPPRTFITPSQPVLAKIPPTGKGWLHEIKFDGYRAQIVKSGAAVRILSKSGKDFTARFKPIAKAATLLPVRFVAIDAEIVASDAEDRPDFRALHSGAKQGLTAWCFDLLAYDDRNVLQQPLEARRDVLSWLLRKVEDERLRFSESFDDPIALLEQAAALGLEGIVSKKAGQAYVSGKNHGWIKVKTHDWLAANKDRWEMMQRPTRQSKAPGRVGRGPAG